MSHKSPAPLSSQPSLGLCSTLSDLSFDLLPQALLHGSAGRLRERGGLALGGGREQLAQGQRGVLEMDTDLQVVLVSWLSLGGRENMASEYALPTKLETPFVLRSISAWVLGRAGAWRPQQCLRICECSQSGCPGPFVLSTGVLLSLAVNPAVMRQVTPQLKSV